MSGTSLDGIDVAIVRVSGYGTATKFTCEAFETIPYDETIREDLLAVQSAQLLDDIARGNIALGFVFADAIKLVCRRHGIPVNTLDLIGLHGQTIRHTPEKAVIFGKNANGTLQIGDPSVVAKSTGVITIGDFRVADCAVGGEGAPLIPYIDYILFRSQSESRALLNIGGIANTTILPKGCGVNDVTGFDTGPGNMIIDALCRRFFNCNFDKDGAIAKRGTVIPNLLSELLSIPYINRKPPKTAGREMFDVQFIERLSTGKYAKMFAPEDLITTATVFTAASISFNIRKNIPEKIGIKELIVSGGGANNPFIMNLITKYFAERVKKRIAVVKSDAYGVHVDAKEAIGFALLANETINESPANAPGATGATQQTILGKIAF